MKKEKESKVDESEKLFQKEKIKELELAKLEKAQQETPSPNLLYCKIVLYRPLLY